MNLGAVTRKAVWNVPGALSTDANPTGDMAGNVKTKPFKAEHHLTSLQVVGIGTPTGAVTLYASNNWNPDDKANEWNGTWEVVDGLLTPPIVDPAGAGFQYFIQIPVRARGFYFDYARSAGSGTVSGVWGQEA